MAHRGIVVSGHMRVEMDSGEVVDLLPGMVHLIPAGHDAVVIGDEPAVMIDVALGSLDFGKPVASERVLATLLFTDIVGSTPLAERLGDDAWKRVLADHDRIIAAAIERFRGRRIQTTGDGVFARFDGAARALQAGLAIRDALRANELEVRIGIHTGEIEIAGEETRGLAIARSGSDHGPGRGWRDPHLRSHPPVGHRRRLRVRGPRRGRIARRDRNPPDLRARALGRCLTLLMSA